MRTTLLLTYDDTFLTQHVTGLRGKMVRDKEDTVVKVKTIAEPEVIKVIDLAPTQITIEETGISIDTKASMYINVIKRIKLEGTKQIDLTKYAFAKKDIKESMITSLLEKMKALDTTGVIPERIEIFVKDEVNYYFIPETLTNQLGYFYGCGTTIVIDDIEFKPFGIKPVYRYSPEKCSGLTAHAKQHLNKETFTYSEIKEYNNYVAEQVKLSRTIAWSHAEHFYRMVSVTTFNKASIVYQPNKKVYKEVSAHKYLKRQLAELLPVTKVVKETLTVKQTTVNGKAAFKADYTNTEQLFEQMVLTDVQRAELDIKRQAYGIDDDTIEYLETNIKTEHGYAQSIPQVYLGKSTHNIKSSYAGGDFETQAESNGTKNVSIWTKPEHFEAKAYINHNVLKAYESYSLINDGGVLREYDRYKMLDSEYTICPVCGLPTHKDRATCDCCNYDFGTMDINIKTLELYAKANRMASERNMTLIPESFEALQRVAMEESEYKDIQIAYYAYTDDVPKGNTTGNRRLPRFEVSDK